MTAVHRVAVLVFDGVKLLDVAGPSEVFAEANRGGANYELVICSGGWTRCRLVDRHAHSGQL